MNKTPEQLLQEQAAIARSARNQSQIEKQEAEQARQQFQCKLLSFDANTGLWRVQLEDGTILYAQSITTGGGKGKGDMASLQKTASGNFLKHMP